MTMLTKEDIIHCEAYARAGLIGNPSDGYGGRTIGVSLPQFRARVTMHEWDRVELVWSETEQSSFASVDDLARDVRLHGYYGGVRLIKATIKKFHEYCRRQEITLHEKNFSIGYQTNIPRQVGLAGSSAIIVATLRCLMEFYHVEIPKDIQPSLVLSVEHEELGITAGLQDRVVQVFEGAIYMDFAPSVTRQLNGLDYGRYEPIDPATLPPLYVAYGTDMGEPTEVLHNDLRLRYERGDIEVVDAMRRFAELTWLARKAIATGDTQGLGKIINENFDLRDSICHLLPEHCDMIERARACGASAKFAGSGGAIIGTYTDEAMLDKLKDTMADIQCDVFSVNAQES